jgi:hypothetical protein
MHWADFIAVVRRRFKSNPSKTHNEFFTKKGTNDVDYRLKYFLIRDNVTSQAIMYSPHRDFHLTQGTMKFGNTRNPEKFRPFVSTQVQVTHVNKLQLSRLLEVCDLWFSFSKSERREQLRTAFAQQHYTWENEPLDEVPPLSFSTDRSHNPPPIFNPTFTELVELCADGRVVSFRHDSGANPWFLFTVFIDGRLVYNGDSHYRWLKESWSTLPLRVTHYGKTQLNIVHQDVLKAELAKLTDKL